METIWVLQVFVVLMLTKAIGIANKSIALPGCPESCGDVMIPYPFGIGTKCSMNESFAIRCDSSSSITGKPYLANTNLEVLGIALTGQVRVNSSVISSNCSFTISDSKTGVDLSGTPLVFSGDRNRFTATGCDNYARLGDLSNRTIGGCLSMCSLNRSLEISGSGCYGVNCCQTTIPPYIKSFEASMVNVFNNTHSLDRCISSFIVEQSWFESNLSQYGSNAANRMEYVPAVLDWGKLQGYCDMDTLDLESEDLFCSESGYCWQKLTERHFCVCGYYYGYYSSSPMASVYYITRGGCEGERCVNLKDAECWMLCMHTPGSTNCTSCPHGYRQYNRSDGIGCESDGYIRIGKKSKAKFILLGCGSGLGLLLILMGMWWLYKIIKRRQQAKLKQKFFKRNGGLLLEQQLSSTKNNVERTQLFTSKDLEKATDHYNTNRILGQGGQGTVYKGMLTDGKIVAVKKSTLIDEDKLEEFINEVVILSQVNHRNVVKLLGCCLETDVPLLVYEFIPNGTLFQYIHDPSEEFPLTWELRLRIATEVSGALSYLHSAASMPIYHRDIKSTNILLDEKYRAKVSDFGTSRTISIDQTHLTTKVQGTFGYVDPEYFQSSQFTEKSDVYSFGVVLVELLTGQKAISYARSAEQRSLATYFLESMEENRLFEILDERVLKEGGKEGIIAVAGLARRCLNLSGKKRPPMRTIAMELERIRPSQVHYREIKQDYEEVNVFVGDIPSGPWEATTTSSGSCSNGWSATNVPLDKQSLPLLNTR